MSPCLDGYSSAIDVRKRPGRPGDSTTCWWSISPPKQVFKDVDNIEPGEDFVERITAAVGSCDVLLALIGPQWLTITDENGQRRLDNPEDYVRLEIETALTRKIRVIPILVDDARMPRANELPATLAPLVRRNAVEINPITFDTKRLIATVQKTLAELKVSDTTTGSAAPTSTAQPDGSTQQVAGPDVEQLYDQALAAFWTERWDEAVDLLGQVLSRQPDYADAARKLELARHQQQLATHYAQASAAADAGDWEQAVARIHHGLPTPTLAIGTRTPGWQTPAASTSLPVCAQRLGGCTEPDNGRP